MKLQVTETYKIQKGYKGIVKVIYMNPAVYFESESRIYMRDVGYMSTPETLLHVQGLWPWVLHENNFYLNSDLIIA